MSYSTKKTMFDDYLLEVATKVGTFHDHKNPDEATEKLDEFEILQLAIDLATKHGKHNQKVHGQRGGGGAGGDAAGGGAGGSGESALTGRDKEVSDIIMSWPTGKQRVSMLVAGVRAARNTVAEFDVQSNRLLSKIDRLPDKMKQKAADIKREVQAAIDKELSSARQLYERTEKLNRQLDRAKDVTREQADEGVTLYNRSQRLRLLNSRMAELDKQLDRIANPGFSS